MTLRFTPNEREVLLHRLGVPDAIAEALTDAFPGDEPACAEPYGVIAGTAETLRRVIERTGELDAVALSQPAVKDILADCVDGSTYFAGVEMEAAPRRRAAIRVLRDLKAKLVAVGCDVGELPVLGA